MPAVAMIFVDVTAAERPAARAKGTVRPSAMPMTTSRTVSDPVKCFSTCGVVGIERSPVRKFATISKAALAVAQDQGLTGGGVRVWMIAASTAGTQTESACVSWADVEHVGRR